jgi:hypothetical protein
MAVPAHSACVGREDQVSVGGITLCTCSPILKGFVAIGAGGGAATPVAGAYVKVFSRRQASEKPRFHKVRVEPSVVPSALPSPAWKLSGLKPAPPYEALYPQGSYEPPQQDAAVQIWHAE